MNFENLDINSIIIIVLGICIGLIKVIEMYKSGSYRNIKLNNSKEEMKQVETLKNKYREKFKNNIKDIKNDMIKEIKNRKFSDELEISMNKMNNINEYLDKIIKIYNDTNTLLTSSSSPDSEKQSLENTSDSVDIEIQK